MNAFDSAQATWDAMLPPESPDIDETEALKWFVREGADGISRFAEALKVSAEYVRGHIATIVDEFRDELDTEEDLEMDAVQEYAHFLETHKPINDWY